MWQAADSDEALQLRIAAAVGSAQGESRMAEAPQAPPPLAPQAEAETRWSATSSPAAPVRPRTRRWEAEAETTPRDGHSLLSGSLVALLLLLPATAFTASCAAAAGARGAAGLRAVALVLTGASGLATCLAGATAACCGASRQCACIRLCANAAHLIPPAGVALLLGALWVAVVPAPAAQPAPLRPAGDGAPPHGGDAPRLGPWLAGLGGLLLGGVTLLAAAASPGALQRAVGTLLAAALGVSASVALVTAAFAAAAALLSHAAGVARSAFLGPVPREPVLDLPPLWSPSPARQGGDAAPAASGSSGDGPGSRPAPRTTPGSLDEMRQRAREQYFANKHWRDTLPAPGARRPTGGAATGDAVQSEPATAADDFDSRQAARAAWAQRVARAQGLRGSRPAGTMRPPDAMS